MSEAIIAYVKRVKELAEHVRGNEQATKQSLIGPLFTILGYDLTDPRECVPEYKVDFGRDAKSTKPIDWAFLPRRTADLFRRSQGSEQEARELRRTTCGLLCQGT